MKKSYYSLGLMSGTSMDGVDASIIQSDGYTRYNAISDKYFKYDRVIFRELSTLRNKIKTSHDLRKFSEKLNVLEKKITIFHAKVVKKILNKSKVNIDFIGFHGQTIFHSAKKKITRQLGDGKLLSRLTKKIVIYNFRKNDLKNGGQGAPLTPIFHKLLANKIGINEPTIFINLGGIANITFITKHKIFSSDIGPANCLIDQWVKTRSKKKCDLNGSLSESGKIHWDKLKNGFLKNPFHADLIIFIDKWHNRSYDIKDFNLNFVNGLSLTDGAATLTEFTGHIISEKIITLNFLLPKNQRIKKIIACGGGRKNKSLMKKIFSKTHPINLKIDTIDKYGIDGDFIESQAFAFLAIRSYLKLPISFPKTTGCKKPSVGGLIIKTFKKE